MATPTKEVWDTLLANSFFREAFAPTFYTDIFRRRGPTEESIKRDVAKLRSVSDAGRKWIADRRMAIASVGPWRDTFVIPREDHRYPAIFVKARQQGMTYTLQQS